MHEADFVMINQVLFDLEQKEKDNTSPGFHYTVRFLSAHLNGGKCKICAINSTVTMFVRMEIDYKN